MPIYEYQCAGCNHKFDVIQKINDAPVTTCPHCSEDKVIRLVSAAGFQLKGSGWYATDFKNKTTPAEKPAEDKASTEKKPNSEKAEPVKESSSKDETK